MSERLVFNYGTSGGEAPGIDRSRVGVFRGPSGGNRPPGQKSTARDPRERRDWAFYGLMAFTAALFFRPQDMIPALAPLHLAEVTAIVALTSLVHSRLSRGLTLTRFAPELVGVLGLAAVILLTAPFSVWMGGAISTFTDLYFKVLLIFILMVNTLTTTRRVEQFTWLIVTALGYIAFRAVFDYTRGVNLIENGRVQGSIGGIFRNPNDLALNLVAVLPLAVSLALRPSTKARRVFAFACAFFMVCATVVTQSRSGTVGLVAMGGILAFKLVGRRPGLVFAAVVAMIMALPVLPASYIQRVSSITNPSLDDTGSREARRKLLREAYQTFLDHPFTGVGAGQFKNYAPEEREEAWRETHNVVLQVASELGVLGLVCFGFLLTRGFMAPRQTRHLLRRVERIARDEGEEGLPAPAERASLDAHQLAMGSAIAGWFVCALFASVAYHWTFYYLLAMAIAPREILLDRLAARSALRSEQDRVIAAGAHA
jgi:putative inorganic carbon (hco3(-)) transporter